MRDITTQLRAAVGEEPPLGFGAAQVIAQARRTRRRRRISLAGTVSAVAAAAIGTGLAVAGGGAPPAGNTRPVSRPALSFVALSRTATGGPAGHPATTSGRRIDGWTARTLAAAVQQDTGVTLTGTQVSVLNPPGILDLSAAIAVHGHPSINVQVTRRHTMSTAMPTCAGLSSSSGNGDGFYGPCRIQRLGDGSILVVRSGRTRTGGNAMAQAVLIRPDGSGFFAEDTNQAVPTTWKKSAARAKHGIGTAVRAEPVLDAAALAKLVQSLASEAKP